MPSDRQYELIYIVAPVATDAEVEGLHGEIKGHIETLGGSVESTEVWGRRKLAYPIGRYGEGIYVAQLINGPGGMVGEVERRLRVRDQVLRHLTVRVDEDILKARCAAEKRKSTSNRRREARGMPPVPEVVPPAVWGTGPVGGAIPPTGAAPVSDAVVKPAPPTDAAPVSDAAAKPAPPTAAAPVSDAAGKPAPSAESDATIVTEDSGATGAGVKTLEVEE